MNATRLLPLATCFFASCFGPESMPATFISPEHVAWLSEVAPHTGEWLAGIEGDAAWVDAFRDDAGWLIVIAQAKDPQRTAYLGTIPATECDAWPDCGAQDERAAVNGDVHSAPVHVLDSVRSVRVCRGRPRAGFLDVEVFLRDPALNSWPYADLSGRLWFDRDDRSSSSFGSQ